MKVSRLTAPPGFTPPPRARRLLRDLGILAAVFAVGYVLAFVLLSPAPLVTSEHAVPRVLEQPLDSARAQLEQLGLRVKVEDQRPHPTIPQGAVMAQDPPAGLILGEGGTVALTVSSGPAYASVPDVRSMTFAQASTIVRLAGFRIGTIDSIASRDGEAGIVITTRPASGAARLPGEKVDFIVTRAP